MGLSHLLEVSHHHYVKQQVKFVSEILSPVLIVLITVKYQFSETKERIDGNSGRSSSKVSCLFSQIIQIMVFPSILNGFTIKRKGQV